MSGLIACGQEAVLRDECLSCGGWLHREQRGGLPGPSGRVCSEDCAADLTEYIRKADVAFHLHTRDLLCACPVCAEHGRPTAAERAEYAAYEGVR